MIGITCVGFAKSLSATVALLKLNIMSYNAILKSENQVLNYEGEKAFVMTPEMELFTAAVTASLSDKFYESNKELVERIARLVPMVSAEFVAKLAVYTRREMHLRSVPLLLLVELSRCHNGDNLVSRAVANTVMRADEISELLACYQWRNPSAGIKKLGKLSRQIQDGLKKSFNRFDEYQFAKYDRDSQEVKLKDALFLVHPKADTPEQQAIFDKIVNGTLETPYTWETQLSALGQQHFDSEEDKKSAVKNLWEELLDSGKLGYMALLRNLRNILNAEVSADHIQRLCDRLSDPEQVRRSKQLPYRFLSAYKEIIVVKSNYTMTVMNALEKAVLSSIDNVKGFDINTNVLLACDISGSMIHPVSAKSSIDLIDVGVLLTSMLRTKCKSVQAGIFGDVWRTVEPSVNPILNNTVNIRRHEGEVGYSTNGYLAIDWLIENNIRMDKVMFFTDCQLWNSTWRRGDITKSWNKYKTMFPDAKLYIFDLAGYGQAPLNLKTKDVFLIAGWSDKVFDILDAVENGTSIIERVNEVEI